MPLYVNLVRMLDLHCDCENIQMFPHVGVGSLFSEFSGSNKSRFLLSCFLKQVVFVLLLDLKTYNVIVSFQRRPAEGCAK